MSTGARNARLNYEVLGASRWVVSLTTRSRYLGLEGMVSRPGRRVQGPDPPPAKGPSMRDPFFRKGV